MTLLHIAYALNILVLIPVSLLALFGGESGNRRLFQSKFSECEGARTILGSLWTAILVGSVLGVFFPFQMLPVLLLQIVYKSVWILVYVIPRLLSGRGREVPWGVATSFLVVIAGYPWIIPWMQLFGSH